MRLVLEELDAAPPGLIPYDSGEQHDRSSSRVADGSCHRLLGEALLDDVDLIGLPGTATHRREQTELVSLAEPVLRRDIVVVKGEEREGPILVKGREAGRDGLPGRLDVGFLGSAPAANPAAKRSVSSY